MKECVSARNFTLYGRRLPPHPSGELDISRYPEFHEAFIAAPAGVPVLLDLTSADSVDSFFLGEMLLFKRRHDAPVSVVIPPVGYVTKVFELTNLDGKMNVYHDLSPAIDALGVVSTEPERKDDAVPRPEPS